MQNLIFDFAGIEEYLEFQINLKFNNKSGGVNGREFNSSGLFLTPILFILNKIMVKNELKIK